LVGVLEQMLEPDPDVRAQSIADLLRQRKGRSSSSHQELPGRGSREPWDAWRETLARDMERWASRFEHAPTGAFDQRVEVSRAMQRMRRKARRQQRRAWRRDRRGRLVPWPFSVLLGIMFTLSIVFLSVATQVVAPLVLSLLSLVFGRALRTAAASVRSAGKEAIVGIRQSRQWLTGPRDDDEPPAKRDGTASAAPQSDQSQVRVAAEENRTTGSRVGASVAQPQPSLTSADSASALAPHSGRAPATEDDDALPKSAKRSVDD
jgi:hypothetical protein